jgi:hypothetical protein
MNNPPPPLSRKEKWHNRSISLGNELLSDDIGLMGGGWENNSAKKPGAHSSLFYFFAHFSISFWGPFRPSVWSEAGAK